MWVIKAHFIIMFRFIFVTHNTVNRVTHHNNLVIGDSCCVCVFIFVVIFTLGLREINEMILRVPILDDSHYILLLLHINRDQECRSIQSHQKITCSA